MRPITFAAVSSAALASLLLTACASTRDVDTRLPAAFEAPPQPQGAVALDRWWLAFEDPELTGLVDQALAASPDARSAAARLREARATRAGALTAFLPQGNPTASASRRESEVIEGTEIDIPGFSTGGVTETYSAAFDVSWELDLFGRIFAARRAANAELAVARLDYESSRASLAANVADSYFQVRGLAIQLAEAQQSVRIQEGISRTADTLAQRGLGARVDVDRIAGDLAQARSQAEALTAELQAARRTLLILVGRGIEPTANLPAEPRVGAIPPVPASIPGEILARRPDVRQAEARLASQLGQYDYAKLAFFPTFRLTPGIGISRTEQPGYSATTQNWTIGGNVSVPLLDIPRLLSDLKVQNARVEQAAIAYEQAVQTAFGEAENALVQLAADRRRVDLLAAGERQAASAYQAAQRGYAAGLTDLTALLQAEASWRAVRSQYTAAQVQALRRAVQTYKALGGGWPAETAPTNKEAR